MITAAIIDDEENLRNGLKAMLKKNCPEIKIITEANSVKSGIEVILQNFPQLVFLDIQLADGTGFDILEKISTENSEIKLQIIFITAHDQYAVKAFKFSAIDYVLKPVDPDDLITAVNKVKNKLMQANLANPFELLLENIRSNSHSKRIALSTSDGIHMFNISDVIRCESLDNYTRFYIKNHKPLLVSKTLKEYEELLTEHNFERVHQSHLINLTHLKSYIKTEGGYVVMDDGVQVPVSQRKRERLLKLLKTI